MKLKTIAATALAVCLVLTCQACFSSNPPASPSQSQTGQGGADTSPGESQNPDEGYAPYFADFGGVKAVFDGEEVNNSVLEFYYNLMVSEFISTYYYNLEEIGLDLEVPFDLQPCAIDQGISWYDYFFENTIYNFHSEYAVNRDAEENGLSLTEQDESEISAVMQSYIDSYSGDVSAINGMLKERFGKNTTFELFEKQVRMRFMANRWRYTLEESLNFSDEELRAVFTDEEFESLNYNMVSVRHILVNDEETAAQILDEWNENPTEENFGLLASMYTEDTYSAESGGLYENIMKGEMVPEFEDWCYDESRQMGDTGIVGTDYGYHVMFFSSIGDLAWQKQAQYVLGSDILTEKINAFMDKYTLEIE